MYSSMVDIHITENKENRKSLCIVELIQVVSSNIVKMMMNPDVKRQFCCRIHRDMMCLLWTNSSATHNKKVNLVC